MGKKIIKILGCRSTHEKKKKSKKDNFVKITILRDNHIFTRKSLLSSSTMMTHNIFGNHIREVQIEEDEC